MAHLQTSTLRLGLVFLSKLALTRSLFRQVIMRKIARPLYLFGNTPTERWIVVGLIYYACTGANGPGVRVHP